ncbi:MAG: molybdopterin-dependent oxidoreductase [Anaerolineae bacterium]|nr:molybdopterin-dependent oxidoreductase [Anaerolineae bacterium]MDW8099899.1 molybdopterin-dependent oxidoreductase [Anaerolineae bacterium]
MVSLTIDGRQLEVPEGITVLEAAKLAGIEIPTLCYHPRLTPYGGCRLCVVEVERMRTLQPSCTLPVSNGMVVYTNTPKVREARKFILTLLFSERNHYCMYCQMSGGDCELQNAAYGEGMTHWPLPPNWNPYPIDASHKYFVLDHNRCIICRRCVRACGELVGNFTLGVRERGADVMIMADLDVPLGESTCISCGTCVQVCPTGALIDRMSAYRGREKDVQRIKSTCVGCSVGCGIELIVRDNHLLRIEGDWDAPVNGGLLCELGRFRPLYEDRERIVTPLVRMNGRLKAATWEEALHRIAAQLKPLVGRNGDGIAALASTRLPAEALYLFKQLFAEKLGSEMVTSIEEGLPTAVPGAIAQAAGRPLEGGLEALQSTDCVVVIGADLTENHQVAGFFVKRALPNGIRLIVIDPHENGLQRLAHYALRPKKGTDLELLLGILAGVIRLGLAKGEVSSAYDLDRHTPEAASQITGVPIDQILAVSQTIATAQKPVFVYGKGIIGDGSPQALKALLELARLVGALDEERSTVVSTKGQANSLAAYLYGLDRTFEVNGHQAVYLALGDDTPSQRLIQRLQGAPFIAVQASYVSPVTAMADVVLPVTTWVEQEGHYLNLDGRLQKARRGLQPPAEVRSNVEVLEAIAANLEMTLNCSWKEALRARVPIVAIRE